MKKCVLSDNTPIEVILLKIKQFHLLHGIVSAVNSEIFARILFSRIALKDIFAAFKLRHYLRHDLPISVNDRVILLFREGLIFTKLRICKVL